MKQGAKARPLLLLAGLLLATGLAYTGSLDGGLLFDDTNLIEQNADIRDLAAFPGQVLRERLGTGTRVLTDLTFALDYARSGLAPRAYHVTSLALHLLAVVLAFLLGRRLLAGLGWPDPEGPALAAAALWALHPLNSQAVNYVVQRAEVMASLFYLLAAWLVLIAVERGRTWAGAAAYLGALVATLAGLDSKQIVVTIPAVVLLALVTTGAPAGPPARRWLVRLGLATPFALLALWVATRTIPTLSGNSHVGFDIPGLSPAGYLLSQTRVLVQYLGLLAWPAGLNLDHGLTPSHSLLEPAVLASTALLLALCAGALALAWWGSRPGRDQRVVAASRLAPFGLAWFFVVLSPTSSVVPLVDLMFEHRVYLASWGVVLAVVVLVSAALSRLVQPPERAATAGLVLVLVTGAALGVALHQRNRVWADPATIWADVVAKAPGNWRGYQNLAQVLASRGQYRPAVELRERALTVARQPQDRAEVLRNLGANLIELQQVDSGRRRAARGGAAHPAGRRRAEQPGHLRRGAGAARRGGAARPAGHRAGPGAAQRLRHAGADPGAPRGPGRGAAGLRAGGRPEPGRPDPAPQPGPGPGAGRPPGGGLRHLAALRRGPRRRGPSGCRGGAGPAPLPVMLAPAPLPG